MKTFLAVAVTCWGVVLIGVLANLAFNFTIPVIFFMMLVLLSLAVAVLTGTALLTLRKVAPGEGWGCSPLGLFLIE